MRTWQVADVMTRDVVTVGERTPYREIVDTLTGRQVSAAPVVAGDGAVVGVVSEADLLHKVEYLGEEQHRRIFASRRHRSGLAKAHSGLARDLMSAPPVTTTPDTQLSVAAKQMDERGVKRLPVVDEQGNLVGIVARSDLLRIYLRPDNEIADDITESVLRRTLMLEPGTIQVRVENGVVTLSGRTDRSSTARLAVRLSLAVAGVVDVADRLSFEYEDERLADLRPYG